MEVKATKLSTFSEQFVMTFPVFIKNNASQATIF